jgi:TonB family protein
MKHPTGTAKPRRAAVPTKKVRLNLQRRPKPEPEDDLDVRQKSNFWKWVLLVALLHLVALSVVYFIYEHASPAQPPQQFISLLPQGDVVKGTPGTQQAHKLGPTTPAPSPHHSASSAPSEVKPVKPVHPKTVHTKPTPHKPPPKSEMKMAPPTLAPITPPPPTPAKPKVKVDLSKLEDAPTSADKPKTPIKKAAKADDDSQKDDADNTAKPDNDGLSKEEVAKMLGEKLKAAGVKNANKVGASGSPDAHANSYSDFYAAIRDQVMSQWESPNLTDETAINPIVQIHVEKDGSVPAELVHLVQSSGNPTYDDSAVAAAKNLGQLHEPLPEGCPPDIPITFKLTR